MPSFCFDPFDISHILNGFPDIPKNGNSILEVHHLQKHCLQSYKLVSLALRKLRFPNDLIVLNGLLPGVVQHLGKKTAYVGIDYHLNSLSIAVVLEDSRKIHETTRLKNDDKAIANYMKKLSMR